MKIIIEDSAKDSELHWVIFDGPEGVLTYSGHSKDLQTCIHDVSEGLAELRLGCLPLSGDFDMKPRPVASVYTHPRFKGGTIHDNPSY